jgi:hypothetical protein
LIDCSLGQTDDTFPKEYAPLDLSTNEGFGKAMSYLSVDKSTQIKEHPTVKIPYFTSEEILKVYFHAFGFFFCSNIRFVWLVGCFSIFPKLFVYPWCGIHLTCRLGDTRV